jgi:hypothetical protein
MNRRKALGLIGAAGAVPLVGARSARAEMLELDPSKPAHTLMITRKLAHTMGDDIVYWWAKLSRMVMLEKVATPMWDVYVAALLKTRDIDDQGGYETTAISMVFYTDVETGEYLRTFDNPITGQTVEINYFPARPSKRITSIGESKAPSPSRPGYDIISSHPLGPAVIEGNDVWVRMDDSTRMEPKTPEAGPVFRVNDWSTYHGSVSDVANTDVKNAAATWHFNDILSFPPWLGMGDRPGDFVSRGFGRKVSSFSAMPDRFQDLIKQRHPDIYQDPAAALRG